MLIRGRGDGVMGGLVPYESATVTVLGLVRSSVGATPRVADCPRAFVALLGKPLLAKLDHAASSSG